MSEEVNKTNIELALEHQEKRKGITRERLALVNTIEELTKQQEEIEKSKEALTKKVQETNQALNHATQDQRIVLSALQTEFINNSRYLKDLYHLIELGADSLAVSDKLTLYESLEDALTVRRQLTDIFSDVFNQEDYQGLVFHNVRVKSDAKAITPSDLDRGERERVYTCRSTAFTDDLESTLAKINKWEAKFPDVVVSTDTSLLKHVMGKGISGTPESGAPDDKI